jgi:hypothetical protein
MTHRVESGWNVAKLGTFTLSVTGNLGTASVSITTGTYCHTDLSPVLGAGNYDDFAGALAAAMDASSASSTPFLIDWNSSTPLRYRIRTVAGFSLTFPNTSAGNRMADALGFARNTTTSTLTGHTGTRRPYYVIDGIMGARSSWTRVYESDDITTQTEAEDGSTFTTARSAAPLYEDWTVPFEELEAVFAAKAASAVPWTWQHFFEHARGIEPFGVFDDDGNSVHVQRGRGTSFKPSRVQPDWDAVWNIELLTINRGSL